VVVCICHTRRDEELHGKQAAYGDDNCATQIMAGLFDSSKGRSSIPDIDTNSACFLILIRIAPLEKMIIDSEVETGGNDEQKKQQF